MEGFWIRVPATGVTVHHGGGRRDHLPGSTQQERAFYMSLVCNIVFLVGFLEFRSVHYLSGPPRTHLLGVCVFRRVLVTHDIRAFLEELLSRQWFREKVCDVEVC